MEKACSKTCKVCPYVSHQRKLLLTFTEAEILTWLKVVQFLLSQLPLGICKKHQNTIGSRKIFSEIYVVMDVPQKADYCEVRNVLKLMFYYVQ